MEKAILAAGCFWGVEYNFQKLNGVISTKVGYTGGETVLPTYKQVCTDTTGHAEAVEIVFDPKIITYEELLMFFWEIHDPTTINRQGPDFGSQYRSAIFYTIDEQKNIAEKIKKKLEKSGKFKSAIVTQILPAQEFYDAEEYHQKYHQKNGGSCSL